MLGSRTQNQTPLSLVRFAIAVQYHGQTRKWTSTLPIEAWLLHPSPGWSSSLRASYVQVLRCSSFPRADKHTQGCSHLRHSKPRYRSLLAFVDQAHHGRSGCCGMHDQIRPRMVGTWCGWALAEYSGADVEPGRCDPAFTCSLTLSFIRFLVSLFGFSATAWFGRDH